MRRSTLTRAASVAAVAAATLGVAGTANAATVNGGTVKHRDHTTLSIVEHRSTIRRGQSDVVMGDLNSGRVHVARAAVLLERAVGKRLRVVQAAVTGKDGVAAFLVRPEGSTKYELVFLGNKKFAPSHSGVVTVKVVR